MCSQPHLLLGFTMLSSTLRKDVFRNCTSCFKASFRHSRDKRQIIHFIPAVSLSMVELCCFIPTHVPTASPSPISATTADVVLGKPTPDPHPTDYSGRKCINPWPEMNGHAGVPAFLILSTLGRQP